VTVAVADREVAAFVDGELLTGTHAKAENTFEQQGVVRSAPLRNVRCDGRDARFELPPLSFAALTFVLG
jgi:hypothetical protein